MPRGTNQKFKFTYLMQIMLEKTDDEHALSMPQIFDELAKYDVTAERKSIYDDFQDMTDRFGIEIIKERIGKETYYHVGSRQFELAEVKLLIDAIQSSKFITQTKSRELIAKIKGFVSVYQAGQLSRQVFINDRVKTMNESIYNIVDYIHTAINDDMKIRFKYYRWDIDKKLVPTHDGRWIFVSPWALIWDDENYYMVAYDDQDDRIKHYRVDKMARILVTGERREGKALFKNFDMAGYSKATFGMYGGRDCRVKIRFANYMCGVFLDRFGKDIDFHPIDEDTSEFNVNVSVSPQFFGWIFSLGPDVRVVGPDDVVQEMREYTRRFMANMEK
ncbi:MAG: WYL domain-containing protein [Lachnospiraceae bacterium]|nr:WYL domain-containing protein [Lachnospiraceae bacterium]